MPVYEFHCGSCGLIFEKLLFHDDIGAVLCPKCLAGAKRVMSTFSISIPDEACGKLPKGEQRELCTECKGGGGACPFAA
jgi:putative FmdB family regulatory protein